MPTTLFAQWGERSRLDFGHARATWASYKPPTVLALLMPRWCRLAEPHSVGRKVAVQESNKPLAKGDYLVVESTYGDRSHPKTDPQHTIEEVVGTTARRGGTVVIPAFAVGRVQALLYYFERITSAGGLGNVPIFLDSPMAVVRARSFVD